MAGCILQHGSLFLKEPEVNTNSIFASAEPVRSPEAPFVTLGEAAGRDITWEQVLAAFKTGFERSLGVDFKHDSLSPEEEAVARRLTDEKYRNSEWLGHTEHTGHVGRL
jgi:lipoate-protein ligase A